MIKPTIHRRSFLAATAGAAAGATLGGLTALGQAAACNRIAWKQDDASKLFVQCEVDGHPILPQRPLGLLDAFVANGRDESGPRIELGAKTPKGKLGPIRAELTHRLLDSGGGDGEDLLEATLRLKNTGERVQDICAGFATAALPGGNPAGQRTYLPLAASGMIQHPAIKSLGYEQEKDPDQPVGNFPFHAYYLEPLASDPAVRHGRNMLLVPVVDVYCPESPWRFALFTKSGVAQRFETVGPAPYAWTVRRGQSVGPGETVEERCYLLVHRGEADAAWRTFHCFANDDPYRPIEWLRGVRVHYYDFLSARDPEGRRGDGFEADLPLFRQFGVGLATQHGYYPWWGQYIDPKLKEWEAMRADKRGPAKMSLEKMRARIAATRREGAKAGVYMHLSGLNETAPVYDKLRDAVLRDDEGRPIAYFWQGPDTPGTNWQMSIAAPEWRNHLLRQARLIMETLDPDAIVIDETFGGLGYDGPPARRGCLSSHSIAFFKELRKLVRSFGADRAVLTSDCSMAAFVPWADGEAGDHAYRSLLGDPLYRKTPVRYTAALDGKPWTPCAWNFRRFWNEQMDLARKTGAGVGVSNGWEEYTGLARLPADAAVKIKTDIAKLCR